jgi:hypothetical protein
VGLANPLHFLRHHQTAEEMKSRLPFRKLFSALSNLYSVQIFWGKIHRALALHNRGEVRSDGLLLTSARTRLQIEWIARDVHPWNRDLPSDQIEALFSEQCLADTSAAISRLFNEVPVLDSIELTVRRNPGEAPILAGTVYRKDLRENGHASIGMRLRTLGLRFKMSSTRLEPVEGF